MRDVIANKQSQFEAQRQEAGDRLYEQSQFFDFGFRIADWGQACGLPPGPAWSDCAKQTQSGGPIVRNKPNLYRSEVKGKYSVGKEL
jgi:hypothetical protein